MTDISMCTNKDCPLRMKCFRYTAIPDPYWQSFCGFIPDESGNCEMFWDNKGTKINKGVK